MNIGTTYNDILFRTYGQTVIHPIALVFALLMGSLILILPRKYVIIALLLPTLFITEMQRIVIVTLDFNIVRILVLFGWIRLLIRNEICIFNINIIDKLIIWYTISTVFIYFLQWKTSGALIYRLGFAFNTIGIYYLFRLIIRDITEIKITILTLAVIVVPFSISMLFEQFTSRNLFSIFGGVPEITAIRYGNLRSQGSFAHPILAGTFGASILPLFVGMTSERSKRRPIYIVGVICATIITVTSFSSGPIMTYIAGIIALCMWPFRKQMPIILFGLLCLIILLDIIMKAPIWALIIRVGVVGGSTAYHRFFLFDQFLRRFNEWWLLGVKSTRNWGEGLFDVTNQFVSVATTGGLITLILFISLISVCFYNILHKINIIGKDKSENFLVWSMGAALFSHCISFMGVAYFDQIIVIWLLLLSMISTVSNYNTRLEIAEVRQI